MPGTQKPLPKTVAAPADKKPPPADSAATAATSKQSAKQGATVGPKAAKPRVKLGAKRASKPPEPAAAIKEKREKLVRDSFTFPKSDFELIDAVKQRAAKAGVIAKKSQVLRAALRHFFAQTDAAMLGALALVPVLKTGRPKK